MNKEISQKMCMSLIFIKFIKLAFCSYPFYFGIVALKSILLTAQTIFNASLLSIFIFFLEKGVYKTAFAAAVVLVAVTLLFNGLKKWSLCLSEIHQAKMKEKMDHTIFLKMISIPYRHLEDPHYLDLTERAKFAVTNEECIDTILTSFSNILQHIFTLLGLASILLAFDFKLILVLLAAALCNLILFQFFSKIRLEFSDVNLDINKRFVYYTNTLLDDKNGKDFRMYTIGHFLREKFDLFSNKMVHYYNHYLRKSDAIKTLLQVVKYGEMAVVYSFVIRKTIEGNLPISSFSLYISAASSFSATISALINTSMSFYIGLRLVIPLIQLMDIPEEKTYGKRIEPEEGVSLLEFKEVTFSYPKSSNLVLDHVSFEIHAGEKISIVGLNGAGKTTLIKLLCRLYQPNSGEILLDGISIYDYQYDSYIKKISTIFQDFKLFPYSIKENISALSDSEEDVYSALCKVGLKEKIDSLPNGIHTLYSKSFDEEGINLSGGQEQKIALARALSKKSDIIILDEPTSALDPLAEADFYENFNQLVKGKTVIYISHRMSSSIFCDKILLLENGKVANYDTHSNLIQKKDSMYYKLFMEQANKYQIN